MVELKSGSQTVRPGGVILFDEVTAVNNTTVMHRSGSGVSTLFNRGCMRVKTVPVEFTANITFPATAPAGETAATAPLSLAIAIAGEPDTTTEMVANPAAAGELVNVSRSTLVTVPRGCCTAIAIENTSNGTILVENASLVIEA